MAEATPPTSCELDRLEPPGNAPMALVELVRREPLDLGHEAEVE